LNVKIGTEAAQFPEKEYINGIFLAVYIWSGSGTWIRKRNLSKVETETGTGISNVGPRQNAE
jgi:hypothetical protein